MLLRPPHTSTAAPTAGCCNNRRECNCAWNQESRKLPRLGSESQRQDSETSVNARAAEQFIRSIWGACQFWVSSCPPKARFKAAQNPPFFFCELRVVAAEDEFLLDW